MELSARMQQRTTTRIAASQKMAAKLIAASAVLQMSSLELQEKIEQELAANPALERVEEQVCPACHNPIEGGLCPSCGVRRVDGRQELVHSALESTPLPRPSAPEDEGADPAARVEDVPNLRDHLLMQAHAALPGADHPIAEYLIANVTDDGHLDCSLVEAAEQTQTSTERVEQVLAVLQSLDPPGVAGRSIAESLIIQCRQLAEEGIADGYVERILSEHWDDLVNHGYAKIARSLKISLEQVQESLDFMRHNLNPYPGRQFRPAWQHRPSNPEALGRPDVIIRRHLDEYVVELIEPGDFALRINESYRQLCHSVLSNREHYSQHEWEQAMHYVERAHWFLQSIQKRRETIKDITECVVRMQRGFLDTDSEAHLRPLTRARVAALVGKHESTVSRATADKVAQLPSGRLISFDRFFAPATAVKSVIQDLIHRENPLTPLTDGELCDALVTRGYRIARRTVAKYRLALRIPSSEQRRKMAGGARHHTLAA